MPAATITCVDRSNPIRLTSTARVAAGRPPADVSAVVAYFTPRLLCKAGQSEAVAPVTAGGLGPSWSSSCYSGRLTVMGCPYRSRPEARRGAGPCASRPHGGRRWPSIVPVCGNGPAPTCGCAGRGATAARVDVCSVTLPTDSVSLFTFAIVGPEANSAVVRISGVCSRPAVGWSSFWSWCCRATVRDHLPRLLWGAVDASAKVGRWWLPPWSSHWPISSSPRAPLLVVVGLSHRAGMVLFRRFIGQHRHAPATNLLSGSSLFGLTGAISLP